MDDTSSGGGGTASSKHDHSGKTVQSWMDKVLSEWYLWNKELEAKSLDYTLDEAAFFESLLFTGETNGLRDGSHGNGNDYFYSYYEKELVGKAPAAYSYAAGSSSFGVHGTLVGFSNTDNICLLVGYVAENSPAERAGMRRGDCIRKIDGTELSRWNQSQLLERFYASSDEPLSPVRVTWYEPSVVDGMISFAQRGDATLTPEEVRDNPVYKYNVSSVTDRQGQTRRVGYLMYNYFSSGYPEWTNHDYDNELKRVFREEFSGKVTDFILDLRYNTGGSTDCALLLASLLVPEDRIGKVFKQEFYNETVMAKYDGYNTSDLFLSNADLSREYHYTDGTSEYRFGDGVAVGIGLSRIYILTSNITASASELIINGLRGVDVEVCLVGLQTLGKNVGMINLNEENVGGGVFGNYRYTLWPVAVYAANAKDFCDYSDGFAPDYEYAEWWPFILGELGTTADPLYAAAMEHIQNGSWPAASTFSKAASGSALGVEALPMKQGRRAGMFSLPPQKEVE